MEKTSKPVIVHPDALRQCGGWLDIADYCGTCDRCKREGWPYAKQPPKPRKMGV